MSGRNSSISPKEKKNPTLGRLGRTERATGPRSMRSISLPMEDTSTLTTRRIMSMDQNELLECIMSRLEELENSQKRTSLQVRVLINQIAHHTTDYDFDENISEDELLNGRFDEDLEQDLDVMMKGDGEDEAWLLETMRKGTPVTALPYEDC